MIHATVPSTEPNPPPRFTVLASGSAGNSSLMEAGGFGLLIDIGLTTRQLTGRLIAAGRSWQSVQAVLLTHTHTDHWKPTVLTALAAKRIPLYCHGEHLAVLEAATPPPLVAELKRMQLLRTYPAEQELAFGAELRIRPLALRHDGGPTYGFRFSGVAGSWSLGYAADLGCWDDSLAESLCDVDLLALEFNHDVAMQQSSGRHPHLIARVLGDEGHLSNQQAAELLRQSLRSSPAPRCRQIVQLHLSRQCNRPALAREAAQTIVEELDLPVAIHTASQNQPSPTFEIGQQQAAEDASRQRCLF